LGAKRNRSTSVPLSIRQRCSIRFHAIDGRACVVDPDPTVFDFRMTASVSVKSDGLVAGCAERVNVRPQ
jgi:hypothetical protein